MKTFNLVIILLIETSSYNSETEVPKTDSKRPTFGMLISGAGFSRTFTQG